MAEAYWWGYVPQESWKSHCAKILDLDLSTEIHSGASPSQYLCFGYWQDVTKGNKPLNWEIPLFLQLLPLSFWEDSLCSPTSKQLLEPGLGGFPVCSTASIKAATSKRVAETICTWSALFLQIFIWFSSWWGLILIAMSERAAAAPKSLCDPNQGWL